MTANRLSGDTTIVAIGDSAMWGTGTAYRFKPPNLVHKLLNDGTPIPPVQFRARGGGIIGRSISSADGNFDPKPNSDTGDDDYGYNSLTPKSKNRYWDVLNREARNRSGIDSRSIDNLKWSIRRDIGRGRPTHLQQLDQFADWSSSRTLDVPFDGKRKLRFYRDRSIPSPDRPATNTAFLHTPARTPPDPTDVDMVLLNGGTNDIGLFYMMDFRNDYNALMAKVERYCYRDTKHLLKKARERFPNALLVLLGYPIFLSEWTAHGRSKKFLKSFGTKNLRVAFVGSLRGPIAIEAVIDGGTVFSRSHQHYMRKAAAERDHVEVRNGDPGVMYVARGFGAINAYEGPDTWAWSGNDDDTYERRKHFVKDLVGEDPAPKKVRASIGHPNRRGSIQTARAVVQRYRDRNSLSVAGTAGRLDGSGGGSGPQSLKNSLREYKLFPNSLAGSDTGSLVHALTHRTVDSLQVRFHVGTSMPGLRTSWLKPKVDLYLDISPGRSGSGETFRLDYESDREARDTPQFDGHSNNAGLDRDGNGGNNRVVTEVNVDPMMGRQMDGGVQTNYGRDRLLKEDNAIDTQVGGMEISWSRTDLTPRRVTQKDDIPNDRRDYLPRNRWDTDRLSLSQIQSATLRAEGTSYWALKRVEFSINGELTWNTRRTDGVPLQKRFEQVTDNSNKNSLSIQLFP